jgi:hypothetical protein
VFAHKDCKIIDIKSDLICFITLKKLGGIYRQMDQHGRQTDTGGYIYRQQDDLISILSITIIIIGKTALFEP